VRSAALAPLALTLGLALPATASALRWGSTLKAKPTQTVTAPVDAAYWAKSVPGGSAVAPRSGQVTLVKVRGKVVSGEATILFQDLRPAGGELRVISTTQPFQLPRSNGIYSFKPINFFIQKGDHVGLATIGGSYEVLASVPGASTDGFVGAGKDMNGESFTGSARPGTELLLQVTEH
jgi:hypothetical protein